MDDERQLLLYQEPRSPAAEMAAAGPIATLEYKELPVGGKVAVEGREVTVLAAVQDVLDSVGDVIMPGAMSETIERHRRKPHIKLFMSHAYPLGPVHKAEIATAGDLTGLMATGIVTDHRDFDLPLAQINDGTYAGASIGYTVEEVADDDELAALRDIHGAGVERGLKRIRLYEVSPVMWGANSEAAVLGVKGRGMDIMARIETLESAVAALRKSNQAEYAAARAAKMASLMSSIGQLGRSLRT
jgi:HK97 family phage prohead protease